MKHKIKCDWDEPAKNHLMLKLVFSLELKNSNFRSDGNLPSFDMDESFYSELWSGYLFSNFLNVDGSQKGLDLTFTTTMAVKNLVETQSDE